MLNSAEPSSAHVLGLNLKAILTLLLRRLLVGRNLQVEMEKSPLPWLNDIKDKTILNEEHHTTPYTTQRAPRRVTKRLIKWTISLGFLLTIFFWSGGKFDRFTGGEEDMWLVDAFMQQGLHVTAGPLRGKVAEKLFL